MTLITTKDYRAAFDAYLRKGTPISLATKRAQPDAFYVWRTSSDDKVRPSHAENDGKVFSWSHRPATGHPGENFNCRCTAEPYLAELREFVDFELQGVEDLGPPWSSLDFVRHYFKGGGRAVTLRETGHLREVVEYYGNELRIFREIKRQIVEKARASVGENFVYDFEWFYQLKPVVFSLGKTTVGGVFTGVCQRAAGFLRLTGRIDFYLRDAFTDPMGIGRVTDPIEDAIGEVDREANRFFENLTDRHFRRWIRTGKGQHIARPSTKRVSDPGTPYEITDTWSAAVEGEFHADLQNSKLFDE